MARLPDALRGAGARRRRRRPRRALLAARAGDRRDAALSHAIGRVATHPVWGLPILAVVLFLAYKIVGVFGAGTAVDFVENHVFGGVLARSALDAPAAPSALDEGDFAAPGTERLVVMQDGPPRVRVVAQSKQADGVYVVDPTARIDVYPSALGTAPRRRARRAGEGDGRPVARRRGARVERLVNRWAFALFAWIGVPLLTAFFVGPYGLLTMGVTYAVAIVLPVVTTFFFVFSMLEDSGYLPRLAVMSNRVLRGMGLNGKAVLPMVLGLGCDTMATLTARIMETSKERMLVTLLLALGIPCSSQLSVIFALMQRTSLAATLVWLAVVLGTLLGVGWVAARVLPGDKSDFLLEMPPIRQPMVRNILAKTMARIEWYLKEAVPLFLVGTALLFVLDAAHLLGFVHRAGEPIVHHCSASRASGVSDRVSEALLVGFLRRDFGAAGLLDMARAGSLSPADVAVSMVTITLFIPCIANVFMIAKERGWKVAGAMSAFIFPYAVAVGALVRLGFRLLGGASDDRLRHVRALVHARGRRGVPERLPRRRGCGMVTCPSCGYEFPPESKLVTLLTNLVRRRRSPRDEGARAARRGDDPSAARAGLLPRGRARLVGRRRQPGAHRPARVPRHPPGVELRVQQTRPVVVVESARPFSRSSARSPPACRWSSAPGARGSGRMNARRVVSRRGSRSGWRSSAAPQQRRPSDRSTRPSVPSRPFT